MRPFFWGLEKMFATYEQWKKTKKEAISQDQVFACPTCEGEGVSYEECDCCGHEKEEACSRCEESGRLPWGDLSPLEKDQHFSLEKYFEEILEDAKKYGAYTGRDPAEILFRAGITPATRLIRDSDKYFTCLAIVYSTSTINRHIQRITGGGFL